MEAGYFGDAGGPLPGFNDRRIQSHGMIGAAAQQLNQAAAMQALGINAGKEPSPVERELRRLEANVKRMHDEVDRLVTQLAPVLVPQLDAKKTAQDEQTGVATSPLQRSILNANAQLSNLAAKIAQLRASLSI